MSEIILPLYSDTSTRKLVGREGGAVELPAYLCAGDQVTCQLRLYDRRDGELVEFNPTVRSLRAVLGKTTAAPTDGTFTLRCNHLTPATFGAVTIDVSDVAYFNTVTIYDADGVTELEQIECGDQGSGAAGKDWFLAHLEDFADWFTVEEEGESGLVFSCVSAPLHKIAVNFNNGSGGETVEDVGTAEIDDFHDSAAISYAASNAQFKTAVDAVLDGTAIAQAITDADAPACWLFRLADNSQALLSTGPANTLEPASFVRVRTFQKGSEWWHEVRLVQTPLALCELVDRVLPDAPAIRRIQEGGSESSNDDVEVNEVQALTLAPNFRGTYVLGFDVRKTRLLGIDDGPAEIAEALNGMWKDGQTRFLATNPERNNAYIEFVGPLGDATWPLLTATVKTFEPGVLTFTLDLRTAEVAAALRKVAEVTVNFEVEVEIIPDGQDAEDLTLPGKIVTLFQQAVKITREQIAPEMATAQPIPWTHPPQARDYVPFTLSQIITGQQNSVAVRGNGASREFAIEHGLNTDAIAGVLVRWNIAGGKVLQPHQYEVTVESAHAIIVKLSGFVPTPALNGLAIIVTSAGPVSVFQAHNHTIPQVIGLEDELDLLKLRLSAIEDGLPSVVPTLRDGTSTIAPQEIPIPERQEVYPGRFPSGFSPVEAAKSGKDLPRGAGLLPAIHDATIEDATIPLPAASSQEGKVFKNATANPVTVPGGLGRRSTTVAPNGFLGSDGRAWYALSRAGTTNSFYPRDFERELFVLHVNDQMFKAGQALTLEFALGLQMLKATTKAQIVLVIEVGLAPGQATPNPTGDNLEDVTWNATPLLSQRLVLSELRVDHKFGAAIKRDQDGELSADSMAYGIWTGDAQAPTAPNFVIRARLIHFDTENSVTNERGFVFYDFNNAQASIAYMKGNEPFTLKPSVPGGGGGSLPRYVVPLALYGEASAPKLFGRMVASQAQRINALELDAQDAPTGAALVVELVDDAGASFSPVRTITLAAGANHARQVLATPLTLAAAATVKAKVTSVGSTLPGAWLTLRLYSEVTS